MWCTPAFLLRGNWKVDHSYQLWVDRGLLLYLWHFYRGGSKTNGICLPMKQVGVHKNSFIKTCLCIPDRIGIWKCWFLCSLFGGFIDFKRKRVGFRKEKKTRSVYRLVFEEREKLESPEKTSRSKGENQEQTQSTCSVQYVCCHQTWSKKIPNILYFRLN